MKISFVKPGLPASGVVVVTSMANGKLSLSAIELDKNAGGMIKRAIQGSNFNGKKGQTLNVLAPEGAKLDRVMLLNIMVSLLTQKTEEGCLERCKEWSNNLSYYEVQSMERIYTINQKTLGQFYKEIYVVVVVVSF